MIKKITEAGGCGEGVGGKVFDRLGGEGGEEMVKVRKKEAEGEKSVRQGSRKEEEWVKKVEGEKEGGVRVGSVWVRMGGASKKVWNGEEGVEKADVVKGKEGRNASTDTMNMCTKLVRKYRSYEEDIKWATRGLVGTVTNGE